MAGGMRRRFLLAVVPLVIAACTPRTTGGIDCVPPLSAEECDRAAEVALDSIGPDERDRITGVQVMESLARTCMEGSAVYDVHLEHEPSFSVTVARTDQGDLVACTY
jgi:hypothetical protein